MESRNLGRIVEINENCIEKPTSIYLVYQLSVNFADAYVGKTQGKIHLRSVDFDDPKGAVEKIPDGCNWTMNRRAILKKSVEVDYTVVLIEHS